MRKFETVKAHNEFNTIIKNGHYQKNKYFILYNIPNKLNYPRFGLAISTKYGHAFERNKIKRQVRNIVTNNKKLFSNNQDYIIMIRKACINLNYQELDIELINLIQGA